MGGVGERRREHADHADRVADLGAHPPVGRGAERRGRRGHQRIAGREAAEFVLDQRVQVDPLEIARDRQHGVPGREHPPQSLLELLRAHRSQALAGGEVHDRLLVVTHRVLAHLEVEGLLGRSEQLLAQLAPHRRDRGLEQLVRDGDAAHAGRHLPQDTGELIAAGDLGELGEAARDLEAPAQRSQALHLLPGALGHVPGGAHHLRLGRQPREALVARGIGVASHRHAHRDRHRGGARDVVRGDPQAVRQGPGLDHGAVLERAGLGAGRPGEQEQQGKQGGEERGDAGMASRDQRSGSRLGARGTRSSILGAVREFRTGAAGAHRRD